MAAGPPSADQKGVGMKYDPLGISLDKKPKMPAPKPAPKKKPDISIIKKVLLEKEKERIKKIVMLAIKNAGSAKPEKSWVNLAKNQSSQLSTISM